MRTANIDTDAVAAELSTPGPSVVPPISLCTMEQIVLHVSICVGFVVVHLESSTVAPLSSQQVTEREKVPAAVPVVEVHVPEQAVYGVEIQLYSGAASAALAGRSHLNE